jgi:uncharacterized repeat protein (TIGR03803 family)
MLSACGQGQVPVGSSANAPQSLRGFTPNGITSRFQLLYSFSVNRTPFSWAPESSLTFVDGDLYGTTELGGTRQGGTMFTLGSRGRLRVLHNFKAKNGFHPTAGVTEFKGLLYGTTEFGGLGCRGTDCGAGVLYSISPSGLHYRVVHSFTGLADGGYPSPANLIVLNGKLYGTTLGGGTGCASSGGCGTVFAIDSSGNLTTVYAFRGAADGQQPMGVVALNGTLYGTTTTGGAYTCSYSTGCGTIFSLTTSGAKATLFNFSGRNGYWPLAGLTALNGALYGTASRGGVEVKCIYAISKGCGTVFELSTSGRYRVLHRFEGINGDGATPQAAPVALNGTLYGTTYYESREPGYGGAGTVYSVTPAGNEAVLHVFQGAPYDGAHPSAPLTSHKDLLYGTTKSGGASNRGAIFALTP